MNLLRICVMDELGFLHYPLRGIRGGAMFPIKHEPSGTVGGHAVPLPAPRSIRGASLPKNIGIQNDDLRLEHKRKRLKTAREFSDSPGRGFRRRGFLSGSRVLHPRVGMLRSPPRAPGPAASRRVDEELA